MTAAQPLDWIRQIEARLVELDQKPQFGVRTPLNWSELENELRNVLHRPELILSHEVKGWITGGQLFAGLGEPAIALTIEWSPLKAPAYFVTGEQTLKELMGDLFVPEEAAPSFYDPSLVDGFYTYFAAEVLRLLTKQQFASPLSPRLGPAAGDLAKRLGDESCFAIDIDLKLDGKHLWGRLLLSESFRYEWKSYFAHQGPPALSEEARQKIMVDLGLEVGHTRLDLEEWKQVKHGDFVLLDHCSYDPVEHKGSVVLTLAQKPILRGRLKEGAIKITNYPVYEEVSDMRENETFSAPSGPQDEDVNLYGDLGEEEEGSDFEEEGLFTLEENQPSSPKRRESAEQAASKEERAPFNPEQLQVQLTVEVGRVKMSVGELMQLAPGNLLDLHVAPEQGVDLVISGKKIGRGELIRMGDVLGVRILSL